MPRFFLEHIQGRTAEITGEDARHIARVLHMQPGKELVVSDTRGTDYRCRIAAILPDSVALDVLDSAPCPNESRIYIRLYQALPKGEKMEIIVQKAVELGVSEITPVLTTRCISRPSLKALEKRRQRMQRIAYEAAKQCGRGIIPQVRDLIDFEHAVAEMRESELAVMLYEECDTPLSAVLAGCKSPKAAALLVGSEGGFSQNEAGFAQGRGVALAGLGKRILRCETAPLCAVSALLYHYGEF